jgi:hypothetical protein
MDIVTGVIVGMETLGTMDGAVTVDTVQLHTITTTAGMAVVMVITEVMDITMVGIEIIGIMEVMDTKDKQTIITTQVEETIIMVLTDTIELRTALANV